MAVDKYGQHISVPQTLQIFSTNHKRVKIADTVRYVAVPLNLLKV
jgi:hypothetical protein